MGSIEMKRSKITIGVVGFVALMGSAGLKSDVQANSIAGLKQGGTTTCKSPCMLTPVVTFTQISSKNGALFNCCWILAWCKFKADSANMGAESIDGITNNTNAGEIDGVSQFNFQKAGTYKATATVDCSITDAANTGATPVALTFRIN
jgi:hypothetical protein